MLKFLSIGVVVVVLLLIVLFRKSIKPFFRFVFSKTFLINLVLALLVLFLVPYFTLKYLDSYTNHGVKLPVPNFVGTSVNDIEQLAKDNQIQVVISDSVYSDDFPRGTVLRQDPLPNSESYSSFVKPNRKIYVTIVKQSGEYKEIPDLTGDFRVSKKIAKVRLEMLGFKPFFTPKASKDDYVLELRHNGKIVKKGDRVLKGERIEVIHGNGGGGVPITLPNVVNKTVADASQVLSLAGLNVEVKYDGDNITAEDSLNFVVSIQNPHPRNLVQGMIQTGSTIYLIAEKGVPAQDTTKTE
ncbi:MAG: PASTA domain-containing protein [Flavobacteriales bacterium]|jgi:beta-lactam-binding protein with PASTA domain|nr:PASTA domain-containing protein [Flavobacteriales bacterium]